MGMIDFKFTSENFSRMKYFQYRMIAMHMFKATGLPAGLTSPNLEKMLLDRGGVCAFNTTAGLLILPFTSDGLVDVYGNLQSARAVPLNGAQIQQLDSLPRILYDNNLKIPFSPWLQMFAERLAEIQTSIQITERQARMPSIVRVSELDRENFERFVTKVDEGYPVIYTKDTFNLDAFQVFNTGFSGELFNALWNDYNKVEGEAYNMLGTMFNVEQNKAAGVGPAETVMNYSQTFAMANARLQLRQEWAEKVNKEFGTNIVYEKASDYDDIIKEMMGGMAGSGPAGVANATDNLPASKPQDKPKEAVKKDANT